MRTRLFIAALVIVALSGAFRAQRGGKITFSETIAPIVYANCVTCHRPGEAAPFPLISYEDVMKRGELITKVTQSRYMPPCAGDRWRSWSAPTGRPGLAA
jgi:hypothetical protein